MKYLVNNETKQHIDYGSVSPLFILPGWRIVEADSEGWIPWSGGECPLPDECKCQIELQDGERPLPEPSRRWAWERNIGEFTIAAYRPILETAEKEEKQLYAEPTKVELLFDRAEQILREAKAKSRDRIIQEARAEKARLRVELWSLVRQHARGPTHEEIMRMKPKELRLSIEGFGEELFMGRVGA